MSPKSIREYASMTNYTAQDWRERAERTRTRAKQIADPEAERVALEIAAGYDRLAAMAAKGALRLALA
jgi:hypothetical protein